MLEMRGVCEKCSVELTDAGEALICSFECTFCVSCGNHMDNRCPNCGGELVKRPRRATNPSAVLLTRKDSAEYLD